MNIQLKIQLRNTLLSQINSLMREYHIPALDMEDALVYIQNELKDLILQDYMQEILSKEQEQTVEESFEKQSPQDQELVI